MSTATVPVTIAPEAAERVAELGMQRELEMMLAHTRQTVPGLRALEVQLAPPLETSDEEGITLRAFVHHPNPVEDRTETAWGEWAIATFAPDVWRHFVLMTSYEGEHGR